MPKRCDCCHLAWRTLFDVFVNGLGWRRYCAACANPPDRGSPRAYTGPYPITRHRVGTVTPIRPSPRGDAD